MGQETGSHRALVGKFEKISHLADPVEEGKMGLKWIFKKWDEVMSCIDLAQNRDRWRALVNAFCFHKFGEFLDCLMTCQHLTLLHRVSQLDDQCWSTECGLTLAVP